MSEISAVLSHLRWQDILDIAILTVVFSRLYFWLRGTFAIQIAIGMLTLFGVAFASRALGLVLTSYVLQGLGAVATLVAVVIFREEIRRALSLANPVRWWQRKREDKGPSRLALTAEGLFALAKKRQGALVVLPGKEPLDSLLSGGSEVDAALSPAMIESIFTPDSPLHDGAAVLIGRRIATAGKVLPLSTEDIARKFGTRHRAAIGLTERCDAICLCVSEERGEVSVVAGGKLRAVPSPEALIARVQTLESTAGGTGRVETVSELASPMARRRAFLRALSANAVIFAAVAIAWYAVAGGRQEVTVVRAPLELSGLPADLSFDPPREDTVLVEVQAPSGVLSSLDRDAVRAKVSLEGAKPGVRRLRVVATAPPGVEVVRVIPESVRIRVTRRQP